jgi:(p)ppGpp synthase/HD superfamily hydrolase
LLTTRFENAFAYASHLHRHQRRKSTSIPYLAHLLAVTALVLEDGGNEDEAIAALLHDAVEDQGGLRVLAEIRLRYGDRVAEIVEGCSDSFSLIKPPWKERKEKYLEHLHTASPEVIRVSLADKYHNASSTLRDLKAQGNTVWERFNGGRQGTLWYYQSLAGVFRTRTQSQLLLDFIWVIEELNVFPVS